MQLLTDWWGITIGAETEQEAEILRRFVECLPDKAVPCYDNGNIEFVEGDHARPSAESLDFNKPVIAFLKIHR